jgi:hypothetical protein
MKEIILTQGKRAFVDDEDFERLSQWKWCAVKERDTYYAIHRKDGYNIGMHRAILGFSRGDGKVIDHINGNGLDNRRENLRECLNRQNLYNRPKNKKSKSKFKGVTWHKATKKWRADIMANYKPISLGLYNSPQEAALAYNYAAVHYHGVFARLNIIQGIIQC